jgi:hypothetical protein
MHFLKILSSTPEPFEEKEIIMPMQRSPSSNRMQKHSISVQVTVSPDHAQFLSDKDKYNNTLASQQDTVGVMSKIVDQRAEATKYIEEKRVNKLFDILGSQLARTKPDDPNEYLLSELKRIPDLKAQNEPVDLFNPLGCIFTYIYHSRCCAHRDIIIIFYS